MNSLKNTDTYYEGELINMSDFFKRRTSQNRRLKNKNSNDFITRNELDYLTLKIKDIDKKLDKVSNYSEETKKENSTPSNIQSNPSNDEIEKDNKLLNYYNLHPFGASVAASIIATLSLNFCNIFLNTYILFPSQVNSTLKSIESKLDNSQNSNDSDFESKMEDRIKSLEYKVNAIAIATGIYLYSDLEYTDDFISKLSEKSEIVETEYYSSEPPCKNSDVIAINSKNGDKYTKEQLVGEKLLIPYTYNGQEVLFYGQYNEKNNWDQDCTINVYENNKLVLISETFYDNGIPSSFKQVFPSHTKEGTNVWSVTDRHYDNDSNYGETWNYFKFHDRIKILDFDNAKINDIIYVSDFEYDMKTYSSLEGYYYGKIQNGKYNDSDNNNESYMVKYDKDGFIRTIYIGNFKDGDFNDRTGKAEEIVYDESVNRYFHYTGTFTDGHRDDDDLNYVTQEEIDEIIKPYNFNCELNWRNTTKDTN